jgi:hypothetical protein
MNLRDAPATSTEMEVLRHGLSEIGVMAPGHHLDPDNHCYGVIREIKEYAQRVLAAASEAPS